MKEDRLETDAWNDDSTLLREMQSLWSESDEIWDQARNRIEFGGFVSADYVEIYRELVQLQGQVETVLEWGSGLGVVTIMASRLGFAAHGIEVEPLLVEHSRELAEQYGPEARFAEGSFIPDDYQWNPECGPSRTEVDSPSAYDDLDMELRDFDLVYAYPWPEEHDLFLDIMRCCGRENSLFLSYDAREGTALSRIQSR